jgi:hypothetical protein
MSVTKNAEPPLVDVKVTNPVTYIKRWWSKIMGNEGIDFRFHIRPVTAIFMAIVIASIGFGVGRIIIPFSIPFLNYEYIDPEDIIPTPETWKETAYTGTLRYSDATNKYYLVTTSSEAITLEIPTNINLSTLIDKRIFAAGKYNKSTRTLLVTDAKDLEVLPKTPVPVPTNTVTVTPTATDAPTATPSESPTESPSPTT